MTTITRERVAEIIHAAGLEPCDYEEVFGSIKTGEIVAMARIALASLTAESVLYAAEETLAYANMGELHLTCLSEPMGDAVIPLYAAPPVPVVPAALPENDDEDGHDIDYLEPSEVYALGRTAGWNACRAAMLQGAEHVSNRDELPVIGWLRSDYNSDDKRDPNAPLFMLGSNDPSEAWGVKYIPLTGNSPVIPDGWVLVPIEPTEHMIVEGFESEPDEFFSDAEVWDTFDAMSGCQQAAHRARLCWEAMIKTAPKHEFNL